MRVKIIKRQNNAALVQWSDSETSQLKRGIVPKGDLTGSQVSKENLEKAIPYGDDFENLRVDFPDKQQIVNMLHEVGVWTKADIKANMSTVRGVVQRITVMLVRDFQTYAKEK